jgi:RNA polymerase sigma-70 factor, ECF subfamily
MQVGAQLPPDAAVARPQAEVLWLEVRERLGAFVARRISNHADVDDLVQWVFLRMHQNLDKIRHGDRIHAWLYSTARRAIADYYRSGRRREVAAGDAADLEELQAGGDAPPASDDDARREVAACLAPVVERLEGSDQEAIRLSEVESLTLAEAAARAGISLSAMKSRVRRARLRLRKAMLDCCHLALDVRGAPMSCAKREPVAGPCCPKPAS